MKITGNILLQYTIGLLITTCIFAYSITSFINRWTEEQTISHHIDLYPEIIHQKVLATPSIASFFKDETTPSMEADVNKFYDEIKSFGRVFRIKVWGQDGIIK